MAKKLENYSKSEIIQAIRKVPKYMTHGTPIEELIIDQADCLKREEIFAKAQMARETAINLMNEFFAWKKEMTKKYGNGERVSIKDIPLTDRQRGAELQQAWLDSETARKEIEKEEDKYYGKANKPWRI